MMGNLEEDGGISGLILEKAQGGSGCYKEKSGKIGIPPKQNAMSRLKRARGTWAAQIGCVLAASEIGPRNSPDWRAW